MPEDGCTFKNSFLEVFYLSLDFLVGHPRFYVSEKTEVPVKKFLTSSSLAPPNSFVKGGFVFKEKDQSHQFSSCVALQESCQILLSIGFLIIKLVIMSVPPGCKHN